MKHQYLVTLQDGTKSLWYDETMAKAYAKSHNGEVINLSLLQAQDESWTVN